MGNYIICQHCRHRRSVTPLESRKIRVLLVGLDNAGKTTAAKGLVGEPVSSPAPTLGFSRLELRRRGWTVELYDVGGGRGIRGIWRNYLAESHGLVFVVDASDATRSEEGRETLHGLLKDPRVRGKPVLVLANKQDAPSALDEVELNERLQLETAANQHRCPMRIELSSALLGSAAAGKKRHLGVQTGFNWLADYIIDNISSLEERVTADLAVRAAELEQQRWARDERIRRSREAAVVAVFAAADDGGREREEAAGDHVQAIRAPRTEGNATTISPPNPLPRTPPNVPPLSRDGSLPLSEPPSPDTPLQPELEAQIEEVFTRTEMGRLVRRKAGTGENGVQEEVMKDGGMERMEGQMEGGMERAVREAGAGKEAEGIADEKVDGTLMNGGSESGATGGNGVENDRSGGGGGRSGSWAGGNGGSGSRDEGTVNSRAAGEGSTRPVVVHPVAVDVHQTSRESPDSPVLEDSGQGSTKESDSEILMSSNASQGSAQANGLSPPRRRNRFFKRYTKTAPLRDDMLMTSLPSQPPTRNE